MKTIKKLLFGMLVATAFLNISCSKGSFSLMSDEAVFTQSVTQTNVKVDILWVVDNSGSMETSQANVANNFQAFINKFQQTNFDYQIAVTTTEAWRAPVDNNTDLARFRDGTDLTSYSGIKVIRPDTPDLEQTFITNITQGTRGSGDERPWQSLREALSLQANLDEPFPRPDALLAVIILADEDDFSHNGNNNVQSVANPYDNPILHDPMMYHQFLYNLTNSTDTKSNFIVNAIGIWDQTCLDQLNTTFTGRRILRRVEPVVDATGGYKGSLCDDFTDVLSGITDTILERSTAFQLGREPYIPSIVVKINGVVIPMDPINGWSYEPNGMLIVFHGSAVPGSSDVVNVTFDPNGLK